MIDGALWPRSVTCRAGAVACAPMTVVTVACAAAVAYKCAKVCTGFAYCMDLSQQAHMVHKLLRPSRSA